MKAGVYSASGEKTGRQVELPPQFETPIRPDVISRAVISSQKNRRQAYGPDRESGQRSSARYKGTRKGWGHSYNYGQARIPRLMLKKGGRRVGQAKIVPQAVGGRSVHAPLPWKDLGERINEKERRLAIRSAIAATAAAELVAAKGHRLPQGMEFPLIIESAAEDIGKAKGIIAFLSKMGFDGELARASQRKRRPGVGKMRSRPYKGKKSVLLVISDNGKPAAKAARNVPGVDAVGVTSLNAELLAPGAMPGRLTIWSESALQKMREGGLYGV